MLAGSRRRTDDQDDGGRRNPEEQRLAQHLELIEKEMGGRHNY
jgi:hypothetical protein